MIQPDTLLPGLVAAAGNLGEGTGSVDVLQLPAARTWSGGIQPRLRVQLLLVP